jgi:hypothetical protein
MQKYWRDRAFDHHRVIKEQGIRISRDMPAEIYGAFLTYYTRQELLASRYGEDLMDLLQHQVRPQPYIILDDELGTRRIADLLSIKTAEARQLEGMFMQAFQDLAPGRVFRDEEDFVETIVLPRIAKALEASPEFGAACAALESSRVRVRWDRWDESDRFYEALPSGSLAPAVAKAPRQPLRALRDDKGDTWRFRAVFDLFPADADGNIITHGKFLSWVMVDIEFHKLDRAILESGEYAADVYGKIARAWSGGGPFDPIASFELSVPVEF